MGVSTNFYTFWGIKVPYSGEFGEYAGDHEELQSPMIIDGMSGEYIMLGVILWNSGDFRYDWKGRTGDIMVDPADLQKIEDDYKKKFREEMPQFSDLMIPPFALHCFEHFH